jgi:hypothetical protein
VIDIQLIMFYHYTHCEGLAKAGTGAPKLNRKVETWSSSTCVLVMWTRLTSVHPCRPVGISPLRGRVRPGRLLVLGALLEVVGVVEVRVVGVGPHAAVGHVGQRHEVVRERRVLLQHSNTKHNRGKQAQRSGWRGEQLRPQDLGPEGATMAIIESCGGPYLERVGAVWAGLCVDHLPVRALEVAVPPCARLEPSRRPSPSTRVAHEP